MKISLRLIGVLGLVLFAALFGLTYGAPEIVEESAKGFVKKQIEQEVSAKYQDSKAATLAENALIVAEGMGHEKKTDTGRHKE